MSHFKEPDNVVFDPKDLVVMTNKGLVELPQRILRHRRTMAVPVKNSFKEQFSIFHLPQIWLISQDMFGFKILLSLALELWG